MEGVGDDSEGREDVDDADDHVGVGVADLEDGHGGADEDREVADLPGVAVVARHLQVPGKYKV